MVQMMIYFAMGWGCTYDFASLEAAIPAAGVQWLQYGYSVGVIFYILDKAGKLSHGHGIWYFFVLTGQPVILFRLLVTCVNPPLMSSRIVRIMVFYTQREHSLLSPVSTTQ